MADLTSTKDANGSPPRSPEEEHIGHTDASNNVYRDAKAATEKEHKMTLMEGIRIYPKAVAWSALISTCIVMEGFQVCLLPNFYAFQPFNEKYGSWVESDQSFQVPAPWQAGLSNGANVGSIIGLIIQGWVSERIGYRYTIKGCLVMITGFITILFTAQNVQTLLAGEILMGLPWGVFQTLTISYASEVCPVALRGHLTTYVNFCWGIGQVIGIGSIKGMVGRTDQWAYRIPFALQWMWPAPLFIGILIAPESPWWLVRKGRLEDAKKSLYRLTTKTRQEDFDVDETVAMMVHTTALENKITAGASYWDCFKGVDLRRTEIVCMCWAIQNLSGNSFSGYSTYFLTRAGLAESLALNFALGQYSINCVGVFGAWFLMAKGIGRRRLYLFGLCGLFSILLILGFLGLAPQQSTNGAVSMAAGSLMLVWAMFYQLSVGTVCYSLVAEMPARRLQIKTIALGRAAYNVVAIICSVLTPYMLNPVSKIYLQFQSLDANILYRESGIGVSLLAFSGQASAFFVSSTLTSESLNHPVARMLSWMYCSSDASPHGNLGKLRLMSSQTISKIPVSLLSMRKKVRFIGIPSMSRKFSPILSICRNLSISRGEGELNCSFLED